MQNTDIIFVILHSSYCASAVALILLGWQALCTSTYISWFHHHIEFYNMFSR